MIHQVYMQHNKLGFIFKSVSLQIEQVAFHPSKIRIQQKQGVCGHKDFQINNT